MTDYPVDPAILTLGDASGMDLDAVFAAIEAGRIADGAAS